MKRVFSPLPATPTKAALRSLVRARLREMSPALRAEASLLICQTAAHLPAFGKARCVALFAPLPSEPEIGPLIEEAWAERKRVALPLMIQGAIPKLDWHEVISWDDVTVTGPFGLREPDTQRCPRVASEELDCAFIPGLAFDEDGYRLGRGGGFYDAFLHQATATLPRIGLMFGCQQVQTVPREPHDQALPVLITESRIWDFPSAKGSA